MIRRRVLLGCFVCGAALVLARCAALAQPATEAKGAKPKPATVVAVNRPDAWWMGRHNAMNERVKKGNVDVVFIGDSITQGWEGEGKKVWEEFYAKRNAVNLGIGGDQTQHVLWRLGHGNIDGISPKLAVVMIGTNNAHSNQPAETAAGIGAIVRTLRAKLPETKILLLAIFPRGADDNDALRKKNAEVNQRIQRRLQRAGAGDTVTFLDIGPKFLDPEGKLTKEIMPDLLHLSPKGYQIWAEAIEPDVAKVMGAK